MKQSLFYARQRDGSPFTFKHHGKSYRLFKRLDHEDASYYFTFQRDGDRRSVCLETNQRDAAVLKAKLELDAAAHAATLRRYGHVLPGAAPRAVNVATLGEIEAAYQNFAPGMGLGASTVEFNVLSLRRLVRVAQGETIQRWGLTKEQNAAAAERVRSQSSKVLNGALIKAFQRARLAGVATADNAARQSALVSLGSDITHVRSMFTADWQTQYTRDAGLALPDLTEFLNEPVAQPTAQMKVKPDRALLQKTFDALPELWEADPNAYIALRLCAFSLRAGDVSRARRDWIKFGAFDADEDFSRPPVAMHFIEWPMSKGKRMNRVPITEEDAKLFIQHWEREQSKRPEPERPFLLTAGTSYHKNAETRAHGPLLRARAWMRAQGWHSKKLLHELRALYLRKARAQFGNAQADGLRKAADLGGHRSTHTTQTNYTGEAALTVNMVVQVPGLPVGAPS